MISPAFSSVQSTGKACRMADVEPVLMSVSRTMLVEVGQICGAERGSARVSRARQIAMYLAHVVLGLTLTEVGRIFHRDRTTVRHACALVEDRRDNAAFDQCIDLLERQVEV